LKLEIVELGNGRRVFVVFKNRKFPLVAIASTGTLSLWLFYYWMERCSKHISFLYLDEFDAFYHPNLSLAILKIILQNDDFQSVMTTHNTYLADNALMRPDCYFIIKNGTVKSFADRTNKIIREGNNLQRMMLSHEFD
jgi:AAA15 family ATPase/GTPase